MKYHIDSIRTLSIDCSGDFAYAVTRYDATNNGQTAFGVNIVVLKKIGGKWLIVAHEAAVPDPNMSIQSLYTLKSH
jgi:ketosteroid isomerase-like protein